MGFKLFPAIYKRFRVILKEEKSFRIALSIWVVIFFMNPTTWDLSLELIKALGADGISATASIRAVPYFSFLVGGITAGLSLWFKTYVIFPFLFGLGMLKALLMRQFIEAAVYLLLYIVLFAVFHKINKKQEIDLEIQRNEKTYTEIKQDILYRNPDSIPKDLSGRFDDF